MREILTPISPGELLDKLTILTIKLENIIPKSDEITALNASLLAVNKELWDIEDDIRDCERAGDFGDEFIRLARAVYVTNDKRADLKKQINLALGSEIVEEKSYADY